MKSDGSKIAAGDPAADRAEVVRRFAELYWSQRETFFANRYLGVPTLQHPFDAWVTQEILCEVRPDVVVEIGSFCGGSAVHWATILEQVNPQARVVAVDIDDRMDLARALPVWQRRVTFLQGSSVDPAIVDEVHRLVAGDRALVILDSDHTRDHVLAEIDAYASLVAVDSYLIVQDTFVNGHPLEPDWGPGPWEAVHDFLARDDRFEIDRTRERMIFTFNPDGFLRRVR